MTNNKPFATVETLYTADEGGTMELWSGIAWFLLIAVSIVRITLVVGVCALILCIIKGVRERALT